MFKGTFLYLGGAGQVFIGALDWGSPMSNVDFKKWQCCIPYRLFFPMSHVEFKKKRHYIVGPYVAVAKPYVEFKKCQCRPVDFRGMGHLYVIRGKKDKVTLMQNCRRRLASTKSFAP